MLEGILILKDLNRKSESELNLKAKLIANSKKKHFKKSFLGKFISYFQNLRWQIKASILIIFIFLVALGSLFSIYKYQQVKATNELKKQFSQKVLTKKKINHNAKGAKGKTVISDVQIVTPALLVKLHKKAVNLGYEKFLIGKLTIPKINLKDFPIYQGMNKYTLALGGATYNPKDQIFKKGNFIIGAHNTAPENFMFTNIGKLKIGDSVKLENGVGKYFYIIDSVRHNVNPYQSTLNGKPIVSSIFYDNKDKRYLTLFTCEDQKGNTRTVVTAIYKYVKF